MPKTIEKPEQFICPQCFWGDICEVKRYECEYLYSLSDTGAYDYVGGNEKRDRESYREEWWEYIKDFN